MQDSERAVLALDGLATVSEVYLNGERVLASDSMFATHELDVGGRLRDRNELVIVFRALAPLLARSQAPARPVAHAAGGGRESALLPHHASRPRAGVRAGSASDRSLGLRCGSNGAAMCCSTASSCARASLAPTACSRYGRG